MKFRELPRVYQSWPGTDHRVTYRDAAVGLNCEWNPVRLSVPAYFWGQLRRLHAPVALLRNSLWRLYQ